MLSARTFRRLRISVLLLILLVVLLNTWLSRVRSTDWQDSLWVVVYPLNSDGRADTQRYVESLGAEQFSAVSQFFTREAQRYGVPLEDPVIVQLADQMAQQPPELAQNPSRFESVRWSLAMRWWAWRHDNWVGPAPDVRIFVRYHSPQGRDSLAHSLGLQKGLIGLVNAFADARYEGQNAMVAVHELLHTLGATDKYDPASGYPLWPDGFAQPGKVPRYPQLQAEVMAGRLPLSEHQAVMPQTLDDVVLGPLSAAEINWR
ncbi:hypothetical protein [Marinobacterium rhizophilum]|uniref:Matrixin n=1 Tax=Marinobacterium rhizophilum TaxID=420402 RepID=A0ABY5HQZ0_9GAMM|nr:hypothetical protein [Marinobacterium rhizophilum]UTW13595.1 hypothetical protein KDW95_08135 [Marinobacterium rhizophilum]